tara:strand:- start:2282 stop:2761 length:480 start_codon:yes stop_codon:yes gene_type:complete
MTTSRKPNSSSLSLLVRRLVNGDAERVFKAWTSAAQILQWWGPSHVTCPQCDIDLRVGGRYRIANLLPDGSIIWIIGQFLQIDRPHLVQYSWQAGPDPEFDPDAAERVTVRFVPKGAKTEIIVEHSHMPDRRTRDDHYKGWLGCLDGLELFLADATDPE